MIKRMKKLLCGVMCLNLIAGMALADNETALRTGADSTIKADVNCDGIISIVDFLKFQQYLQGKITLNEKSLKNADIDDNGKVDVLDVVLFKKLLLQVNSDNKKPVSKMPSEVPDPSQNQIKKQIADQINQKRISSGKKPLTLNAELSYVADIRAIEISDDFQANRPDGSTLNALMSEYGIHCINSCQYIMKNYGTKDISSALISEDYLDEKYDTVGIGEYNKEGLYLTILLT